MDQQNSYIPLKEQAAHLERTGGKQKGDDWNQNRPKMKYYIQGLGQV